MRVASAAICVVIAAQLFNGAVCYKMGVLGQMAGLAFVAVGFAPGLAALFSSNPLRTVGAAVLFVPWLALAFYTDCIRPYQGGGASMVYVAVAMYGFVSSAIGAVLAGLVLRMIGCSVGK